MQYCNSELYEEQHVYLRLPKLWEPCSPPSLGSPTQIRWDRGVWLPLLPDDAFVARPPETLSVPQHECHNAAPSWTTEVSP